MSNNYRRCVGMMILNTNNEILVGRRLDHPSGYWQMPQGGIDENENPEETAKRECLEETGCVVNKIHPIQSYFPAPGSSESYYHLFLGEINGFDGERIKGLESENENILVKSFKVDHVRQMLRNNQITNGLTLIALQWFFLEHYKD